MLKQHQTDSSLQYKVAAMYTEDLVKYTEILVILEVVLQSMFSRFYFNCSVRIWQAVPRVYKVLPFSVLTQRRGMLNLFTSIKISILLF